MKETTELLSAIFSTLNTVKLASADGKLDLQDLPLLLPLISRWSAAIKDLRFAQEARAATPGDIDTAFVTAARELTAWPSAQAAGFTALFRGMYYGYWLASNAGYEAAIAAVELD